MSRKKVQYAVAAVIALFCVIGILIHWMNDILEPEGHFVAFIIFAWLTAWCAAHSLEAK
jgi:hypothetical protein